jgi:hypothetical protein
MPTHPHRVRQRGESTIFVAVLDAVQDILASAEVRRFRPKTQEEDLSVLAIFGRWCGEYSLSQEKKTSIWTAMKVREKRDPAVPRTHD